MKNVIRIVQYFLLFTLVSCIESPSNYRDIHEFLGPPPGAKYVYTMSNGGSVELICLSKDNQSSLRVKEITYFSKKLSSSGIPKSTTVSYMIKIINNQMIKLRGDAEEIVLQGRLDGSSTWEIREKTIKTTTDQGIKSWEDIKSTCKIIKTGKKEILGEERFTVTTQCVNTKLASTYVRTEKYAEGIGLVERRLKAISNNGKETEIYSMKLQKIESVD
jgi:hypothetical protein